MNFFSNLGELDKLGVEANTNKASSWLNPEGEKVEREGLLRPGVEPVNPPAPDVPGSRF